MLIEESMHDMFIKANRSYNRDEEIDNEKANENYEKEESSSGSKPSQHQEDSQDQPTQSWVTKELENGWKTCFRENCWRHSRTY